MENEIVCVEKNLQVAIPGCEVNVNLSKIPVVWDVIKTWGVFLDFTCGPVRVKVQ